MASPSFPAMNTMVFADVGNDPKCLSLVIVRSNGLFQTPGLQSRNLYDLRLSHTIYWLVKRLNVQPRTRLRRSIIVASNYSSGEVGTASTVRLSMKHCW